MSYVVLKNNQGYILFNGVVDDSDWPEEIVVKQLYGEDALVYYNNGENSNPMNISVYLEDKSCKCTKTLASGLIFEVGEIFPSPIRGGGFTLPNTTKGE